MPPGIGKSYVDPVFRCSITRITDSSTEETLSDGKHPGFMNYYSTLSAMDESDKFLLISATNGSWRVKDVKGALVIPAGKMPRMNDGHPVWDANAEGVFYFTSGNDLKRASIVGHGIKTTIVHAFNEYHGITSPDAADVSQDGDQIALAGENADGTIDIFSWSLSRKTKVSSYTTQCKVNRWGITQTPQPGCLHKLQFSADDRLTIQFAQDGVAPEQGLRLWEKNKLVPLQDYTNHYDTGFDEMGRPVFIELGRPTTLKGEINPCPSGWGLDVRLINDLSTAHCLLDSIRAWHVSYRGSRSQPWAAISFFDDRKTGPEFSGNNPNYREPSRENWQLYEDEIILARIDGEQIYRLAQARSRSADGYWNQPHAAISRDGKYVVFTSSIAHPSGCPANMQVPDECTDVYLLKAF
ncbi:MAG: hypothetical protein ACRD40_16155 [Candidatus Acidiferrales bacterium]